MRIIVIFFVLHLSTIAQADSIRGDGSFTISGQYDKEQIIRIKRDNGKVEEIALSQEEILKDGHGSFAMDINAMEAYLHTGKAIEIPSKFGSAKEFLNFADEKRRKIDQLITDPLAKKYIYLLRLEGIAYKAQTAKCKAISEVVQEPLRAPK